MTPRAGVKYVSRRGRTDLKNHPRRIRSRMGAGPPGEGDGSSSVPVGPHRGVTGTKEEQEHRACRDGLDPADEEDAIIWVCLPMR